MTNQRAGQAPGVRGINLDAQTRCLHYHSAADIVAIKMKCCGIYYACEDCHTALAGHGIAVWPRSEWDQRAVLCGACRTELTIRANLDCESRCGKAPATAGGRYGCMYISWY